MPTLYKLLPIQEMRDQNYFLMTLTTELCRLYPDMRVVEELADRMSVTIDNHQISISECELLIDFGDRLVGLTFLDNTSNIVGLMQQRNNSKDLLVYGQPANHYSRGPFRTKQGGYVMRWPFINIDTFYNIRQAQQAHASFIDRIIFRGNYGSLPRNTIYTLLEPKYESVFTGAGSMNPEPYFMEVISHKVGLSIPGMGEFCYRDIEYMALGVPMLRFEYEHNLNPPLIADYHYISIPRPADITYITEREGCREMADIYIDRFLQIKDNDGFLLEISHNARTYYDTYLSPTVRIGHTLNLMEIPNG